MFVMERNPKIPKSDSWRVIKVLHIARYASTDDLQFFSIASFSENENYKNFADMLDR